MMQEDTMRNGYGLREVDHSFAWRPELGEEYMRQVFPLRYPSFVGPGRLIKAQVGCPIFELLHGSLGRVWVTSRWYDSVCLREWLIGPSKVGSL